MVLHGRSAFRISLWGVFLFLTLSGGARAEVLSRIPGVCDRHSDRDSQELTIANPRYRTSFQNSGGLKNSGVCWWHSRLQRAVWSLAEFRPELSKPSKSEAISLIHSLAQLSGVVVIPGYEDFFSFSADFHAEIQRELEQWQLRDGFINQAWIRGISGRSDFARNPRKLKRIMDELYRYSKKAKSEKFIPWVMLQLKGIVSHAALLTKMVKTDEGYSLSIVESNYPDKTLVWEYRIGDGHTGGGKYTTVPYYGYHRDVQKMNRAITRYCSTPAFAQGVAGL